MARLVYSRADQRLYFIEDNESRFFSIEARSDIWPGFNEEGQPRETLPLGDYVVSAEEFPAENSREYGTVYIVTGDPRGRDIHGGGSDLDDPFADEQGFEATYGCIRVQNGPGNEVAKAIIAAGNAVPLRVQEEAFQGTLNG